MTREEARALIHYVLSMLTTPDRRELVERLLSERLADAPDSTLPIARVEIPARRNPKDER